MDKIIIIINNSSIWLGNCFTSQSVSIEECQHLNAESTVEKSREYFLHLQETADQRNVTTRQLWSKSVATEMEDYRREGEDWEDWTFMALAKLMVNSTIPGALVLWHFFNFRSMQRITWDNFIWRVRLFHGRMILKSTETWIFTSSFISCLQKQRLLLLSLCQQWELGWHKFMWTHHWNFRWMLVVEFHRSSIFVAFQRAEIVIPCFVYRCFRSKAGSNGHAHSSYK